MRDEIRAVVERVLCESEKDARERERCVREVILRRDEERGEQKKNWEKKSEREIERKEEETKN